MPKKPIFFFLLIILSPLILGSVRTSARGEISVAALQCVFHQVPPGSNASTLFPAVGDPQVVYQSSRALGIAGWLPGEDRLLLLRDLSNTRQSIDLLDVSGGQVHSLAERNTSGGQVLWWESESIPLFLDWAYTDEAAGQTNYRLAAGDETLRDHVAGLSFDLLPGGVLLYFEEGELDTVRQVAPGVDELWVEIAVPGQRGYPAPVDDFAAIQPFQIAAHPSQNLVLFYNQPDTILSNGRESCKLSLGTTSTSAGEMPVYAFNAAWSPDGQRLALITTSTHPAQARGYGAPLLSSELTILDFAKGTQITLSPSPDAQYVTDIAWSPDSQYIAALGVLGLKPDTTEHLGLFLVAAENGAVSFVTEDGDLGGGSWGTQLAWNQDGDKLAVNCPVPEAGRICILPVVASTPGNFQPAPLSRFTMNPEIETEARAADGFALPHILTLEMLQLTSSGAVRSPKTFCGPGSLSFGCTAFCNEQLPYSCASPNLAYPYTDGIITIPFESEYLFNVIPQELPPWYDERAIEAQGIAARSYAAYHIHYPPTQIPYNNSVGFQAFVPRRFEALFPPNYPGNNNNIWEDPCGESYDSLNTSQRKVCRAHLRSPFLGVYMTYMGGNIPIRSEFASDVYEKTRSTTRLELYPYHIGVPDPISTACDANDFGHYRGMSQEGASRWARGHECSFSNSTAPLPGNDPGEPWTIQYLQAIDILQHYYTGVHLRNLAGVRLTPGYRWLPLQVDTWVAQSPSTQITEGFTRNFGVWIQNTGTAPWQDSHETKGNVGVFLHWQPEGGLSIEQIVPFDALHNPGEAFWTNVPLRAAVPPGDYTVKIDLALETGGTWRTFSSLAASYWLYTPYTFTIEVRVNPFIPVATLYLPLVNR